MTRGIHKLKARAVETASDTGLYGDGGGLYLQITRAGVKSWLFRFMRNGKAHGMGLGPLHTVSLAEARNTAHECRRMLLAGISPLDAKESNRKAQLAASKSKTFEQCASDYIDANKAGWKNAKHRDQWENTLTTYAYPPHSGHSHPNIPSLSDAINTGRQPGIGGRFQESPIPPS